MAHRRHLLTRRTPDPRQRCRRRHWPKNRAYRKKDSAARAGARAGLSPALACWPPPSRVTRGGSLQRRSPLRECHSDKETTDITSHHSPLIRKTHVHIELQFSSKGNLRPWRLSLAWLDFAREHTAVARAQHPESGRTARNWHHQTRNQRPRIALERL